MTPHPTRLVGRLPHRASALLGLAVLSAGCASTGAGWYKGNTHAHTVLCGHADSTPEAVAGWYLDHGFHFLVLSEHNLFIDPADVELPADRRRDFILIPGEEITGSKGIHTTGMNLDGLVDSSFDGEHKHEVIQDHVHGARAAGGIPILNHPNFGWAVTAEDMLPVEHLHHFELYNGHPAVHNEGDATRPSTEELWDQLLSAGMRIWGVSSDDMHNLESWGPEVSNPGRGWVMVRADELSPDAITDAMTRGDFYASSGVILSEVSVTAEADGAKTYRVAVDEDATRRELESDLLVGRQLEAAEAEPGFRIEWIGQGGEVLASHRATSSSHRLEPGMPYLRCRVTCVVEGGSDGEGPGSASEHYAYFAWTQPAFGATSGH